jgi:hypothetical protein
VRDSAGEQADLADTLSAGELPEQPRCLCRLGLAPHLEASTRDQVEGVGHLPLPKQPFPTREFDDDELLEQRVHVRAVVQLEEPLHGGPQSGRHTGLVSDSR